MFNEFTWDTHGWSWKTRETTLSFLSRETNNTTLSSKTLRSRDTRRTLLRKAKAKVLYQTYYMTKSHSFSCF